MACKVIEWSRALGPVTLDRVTPGTSETFEGTAEDADCSGAGVTITGVTATIRADDDDGELTFGLINWSELTFRIPYTASTLETQRLYAIQINVTFSDSTVRDYWYTLPVLPVSIPWAA